MDMQTEFKVVEAPFIQEILGHYRKKIAGMLEDQKTESIIKSDIRLIMQEVSDAEKDTRVEFNFLDRYMQRHVSLVCQAVNVYIYDLNESKKQFYAKLGAEPEMRNLESEIDHAERIKARACGRLPS